jgi:hypothetical protein
LVDVLATADDGDSMVATVRDLMTDGRRHEAVDYLTGLDPDRADVAQIVTDLVSALGKS